MPFIESAQLSPPLNLNATIWRYMDLAKFLSLIDKSALYFVRVDQLANQDPYEGFYTNINAQIGDTKSPAHIQMWQSHVAEMEAKKNLMISGKIMSNKEAEQWLDEQLIKSKENIDKLAKDHNYLITTVKSLREKTFVNSWHIQEHESAAMWNQYSKNSEGIAIESTYKNLIYSFNNCHKLNINVGTVKYIDYQKEIIQITHPHSPYLHKRMSFEHEKELRALILNPQPTDYTTYENINMYTNIMGIHAQVDLEVLIKRIFVAPTAPNWTLELIKSLVKKYELKKDVVRSDLASTPIY